MTGGLPAEKVFRYGWYGDGGLGETMIQLILAGRKTATASPGYDSKSADRQAGDELPLLDKRGNVRGRVLITRVEIILLGNFDEALAERTGLTLSELKEKLCFANGRKLGNDEEMRVIHFRLLTGPVRRKA